MQIGIIPNIQEKARTYLVLDLLHDGHHHVVCAGRDVLVLLAGQNVNAHDVDLGVPMLARLRRGHLHDLARVALQEHVPAFPEGRGLGRDGLGCPGVGRFHDFYFVEVGGSRSFGLL